MQLYGEVGGFAVGARHLSWIRLARESRLKNGSVVLLKGAHWFLFRCHLKGTLFECREREESQPLHPSSTHNRGSTYTLASTSETAAVGEADVEACWRGRHEGVMWEEWHPEKLWGEKEGAGKRHLKQRIM